VVRDTATMLSTPEHPVIVTVEEGEAVTVAADPRRLRQCIENIVANALQKSPAGAPVSVFVTVQRNRADGAFAKVDIVDQGPGIPEDMLPHVFDRFVTGDAGASKRQGGGLGLGLYLAKRIAAIHRGDLTVESKPGQGARFSLTVAVSPENGAARQAAPSASPRQ
jgi:signal transduction histidine kinase